MDKGAIAAAGPIAALKQPRGRVFELRVKTPTGELDGFLARLRAAGLDCHATDEDVMRVFVPGEGGARAAVRARRRGARPGPASSPERADARGRVRARRSARSDDADAMPIHDQGYRRYGGERRARGTRAGR